MGSYGQVSDFWFHSCQVLERLLHIKNLYGLANFIRRRWGKLEKDFKAKGSFDISKVPDIYDCIKYDIQHNLHAIGFDQAEELYIYAKSLADVVIPQEYGINQLDKLAIAQGICSPLLKKIRNDLERNINETQAEAGDGDGDESVNRLNPRFTEVEIGGNGEHKPIKIFLDSFSYSHGVSSPGRHVRTRLYFTSESHIHSLLTMIRYGGLVDVSSILYAEKERRPQFHWMMPFLTGSKWSRTSSLWTRWAMEPGHGVRERSLGA